MKQKSNRFHHWSQKLERLRDLFCWETCGSISHNNEQLKGRETSKTKSAASLSHIYHFCSKGRKSSQTATGSRVNPSPCLNPKTLEWFYANAGVTWKKKLYLTYIQQLLPRRRGGDHRRPGARLISRHFPLQAALREHEEPGRRVWEKEKLRRSGEGKVVKRSGEGRGVKDRLKFLMGMFLRPSSSLKPPYMNSELQPFWEKFHTNYSDQAQTNLHAFPLGSATQIETERPTKQSRKWVFLTSHSFQTLPRRFLVLLLKGDLHAQQKRDNGPKSERLQRWPRLIEDPEMVKGLHFSFSRKFCWSKKKGSQII